MRLGFILIVGMVLHSIPVAAYPQRDSIQSRHRNLLLDAWKIRVERNGGVHPWSATHAGMRVFQEWAALLALAGDSGYAARRRWGKAVERYVVDGNIQPFGRPGTDLPIPGSEPGDFDMVAMNAISLVKLFEADRLLLTDKAYLHLALELAGRSADEPATFDVAFLRFPETENHLFMMESNRFLLLETAGRNPRGLPQLRAWRDSLARTAGKNPEKSRAFLLQAMQNVLKRGFFESNAKVYQRFTVQALNNLYSFAGDSTVAVGAGCVLDYLSTLFALQSLGSIRYGPYRRSSEAYADPALIDRDPLCSFYAVQSGRYPWDPDPRDGFWQAQTSHASTALFSVLLRYRLPPPLLDWMRGKAPEYEAEIRSGYASKADETVEHYTGGSDWLLSAGGRYAPPPGPNFPTLRNWTRRGPWVYDVIARPASLLFFPPAKKLSVETDIIHTRTGWDGDQLAMHGAFLYAYAPDVPTEKDSWPFHIPPGECSDTPDSDTPEFIFRFCDPEKQDVYLVFSKIRANPWKWPWQKPLVRGALEVVPKDRVFSLTQLRERVLGAHREKRQDGSIPYINFDGKRLWLNAGYAPGKPGILRSPDQKWEGLMQARLLRSGLPFAHADGRGALRFQNPVTGETVIGDFREWWRPLRFTGPAAVRRRDSGK